MITQSHIEELVSEYKKHYQNQDKHKTKETLEKLIKFFPNITVKSIGGINLQKIRDMYNNLRVQEWFNDNQ